MKDTMKIAKQKKQEGKTRRKGRRKLDKRREE